MTRGADRVFAIGTASAADALDAFIQAVRATGQAFGIDSSRKHVENVCVALNEHAKGTVTERIAWLAPTVAEWIRSTDSRYAGGRTPVNFVAWLNNRRPNALAPSSLRPKERKVKYLTDEEATASPPRTPEQEARAAAILAKHGGLPPPPDDFGRPPREATLKVDDAPTVLGKVAS